MSFTRSPHHTPTLLALLCALCISAVTPVQAQKKPRDPGYTTRREFRHLFDRPKVAADPKTVSSETKNGCTWEKVTIATEEGVRTPLLIVRSEKATGKQPAILCLHGLGGNKEGMAPYLTEFAKRGFVAVGIDHRYHGDRKGDLFAAMLQSFKTGKEHPYIFDTVWDTWRTIDYVLTRPEVEGKHVGLMGISLGGHATWMACADPRVRVAVPCISVCSWRWQLDHEGYTQRVKNLQGAYDAVAKSIGEATVTPKVVRAAWEKWLPGIPERFDCQDVLAATAPRPLLILNGDSDAVAPMEGQKVAYAKIKAAYDASGHPERLKIVVAEKSGHTVTPAQRDAMYAWFEQWLKGHAAAAK